MRSSVTCVVGVLGVSAMLVAPRGPAARAIAQDHHGGGGHAGAAGALFREQCASCHVTPDPNVATDLAFIRQLQETA